MTSFTSKECQDNELTCDKCKNKAIVPTKYLMVDIALMALQGWNVSTKDASTIMSKKCTHVCNSKTNDYIDDDDMLLA